MIMFAIVAMGIVFSVSGLVVGQSISKQLMQRTQAIDHKKKRKIVGQRQWWRSAIGVDSGGIAVPVVSDQCGSTTLTRLQAPSSNGACGQVVSGVVNLTANLNCSGDGIIVGGPNTVINMNGFSITGPGQDSLR